MIVRCTICGQRFETEGRNSKCPHALLQKATEPSRVARFDTADRRLIQAAIDRLFEPDKHKEAASCLRQSSNPAMKLLAEECDGLSGSDLTAQFEFRKELERAGF
jgi:hypothetical protein